MYKQTTFHAFLSKGFLLLAATIFVLTGLQPVHASGYYQWTVPSKKSQPIQMTIRGATQDDDTVEVEFFAAVPERKRLVMQHASFSVTTPALAEDNVSCRIIVTTPGVGGEEDDSVLLALVVNTQRRTNNDVHTASSPITLYAEAGASVVGQCRAPASEGQLVTLSATLVGTVVKGKARHY